LLSLLATNSFVWFCLRNCQIQTFSNDTFKLVLTHKRNQVHKWFISFRPYNQFHEAKHIPVYMADRNMFFFTGHIAILPYCHIAKSVKTSLAISKLFFQIALIHNFLFVTKKNDSVEFNMRNFCSQRSAFFLFLRQWAVLINDIYLFRKCTAVYLFRKCTAVYLLRKCTAVSKESVLQFLKSETKKLVHPADEGGNTQTPWASAMQKRRNEDAQYIKMCLCNTGGFFLNLCFKSK